MEELRTYILSVTAAAILCAMLMTLAGKEGTVSSILKLMSGTVLAAIIIRPVANISVINLHGYLDNLNEDALEAVAYGTAVSEEAVRIRIIEQSEAYILDKAAKYGMEIGVTVSLDDALLPAAVEIRGNVSPAARAEMQSIIQDDLGIPVEAQIWK